MILQRSQNVRFRATAAPRGNVLKGSNADGPLLGVRFRCVDRLDRVVCGLSAFGVAGRESSHTLPSSHNRVSYAFIVAEIWISRGEGCIPKMFVRCRTFGRPYSAPSLAANDLPVESAQATMAAPCADLVPSEPDIRRRFWHRVGFALPTAERLGGWTMHAGDTDAEVRLLAYRLWEEAGRPCGREHEFWAAASKAIEGATKEREGPQHHVAR